MCGIAGILDLSIKREEREAKLQEMLNVLNHRGPDDVGIFSNQGEISIGMTRLSIIDPETGKQPLRSNCKNGDYVIVFNGEIYNHRFLRNELSILGHKFSTHHSDTEIILHAFEEWGVESFSRLNGMFAFAIWDSERGRLIIARDRFGEKPLYYSKSGTRFVFASEIKAINQISHDRLSINPDAVRQYLTYGFCLNESSFISGVNKLGAGKYATLVDGILIESQYFEHNFSEVEISQGEAVATYGELLSKSVELRMETDVPIGVFLSGGLDSSSIAYYASKVNPNIQAFSIGFENPEFSELDYSELVAKHLGLKRNVKVVRESDLMALVDKLPFILDEPMADPSIVPTSLLCDFANSSVKVALGGDGSDELAFGYKTYKALYAISLMEKMFSPTLMNALDRTGRSALSTKLNSKIAKVLNLMTLSQESRVYALTSPFDFRDQAVIRSHSEVGEFWNFNHELPENLRASTPKRWMNAYISGYLREDILVKIDRASMAASLELRSPFLDHELSGFMLKLSMDRSFRFGVGKRLLRSSMAPYLPSPILKRPKQGFGMPIDAWFRGNFGLHVEHYLLTEKWPVDWIDYKAVKEMYLRHRRNEANYGNALWALLVLQIWSERWLG